MISITRQLPLNVQLPDGFTFDNFVFNENRSFVREQLEGRDSVWLTGAHSSGKTHLLSAVACAQNQTALYLPADELVASCDPSILDGLEATQCLVFDDIDKLANTMAWSEALFHLFNRHQAKGGRWICSSQIAPRYLDTPLADLRSRLTLFPAFELTNYSDQERVQIFSERARFRGVKVSEDVYPYILNHLPRDLRYWLALLEQLDQASLAEQRKITIPLVKLVLQQNESLNSQLSLT
jgi:DnaA family protein